MDEPRKALSMLERYVEFMNISDREVRVHHPLLPNGGIVVKPGEITTMCAKAWSQAGMRKPGLKRKKFVDAETLRKFGQGEKPEEKPASRKRARRKKSNKSREEGGEGQK